MIFKNVTHALLLTLVLVVGNAFAAPPATVVSGQSLGQQLEIQVSGMTCPFCVYGVEKKLGSMPGVEKVRVSLKDKKAEVVMKPGQKADLKAIRAAITDAGFTPGEINTPAAAQSAPVTQ